MNSSPSLTCWIGQWPNGWSPTLVSPPSAFATPFYKSRDGPPCVSVSGESAGRTLRLPSSVFPGNLTKKGENKVIDSFFPSPDLLPVLRKILFESCTRSKVFVRCLNISAERTLTLLSTTLCNK